MQHQGGQSCQKRNCSPFFEQVIFKHRYHSTCRLETKRGIVQNEKEELGNCLSVETCTKIRGMNKNRRVE